jgi:putative ABC transport system permease protein
MVQRTKEIGIRKVLGATIGDILSLVSKDFVKLVLVAMLVAMPSVWLAVNKWLQAFSYRTPLQWWVFPATGIAVLLLALVTIGLQAIKTALSNPIKNLRTE